MKFNGKPGKPIFLIQLFINNVCNRINLDYLSIDITFIRDSKKKVSLPSLHNPVSIIIFLFGDITIDIFGGFEKWKNVGFVVKIRCGWLTQSLGY